MRARLPVLIVDDSDVVRRVLVKRVQALGLVAREESSAAMAKLLSGAAIACAVLDLELGDGDGAEIAAALRVARSNLPIAFFTGGASPEIMERARALGPVFAKPDDVDAVVAWIEAATKS